MRNFQAYEASYAKFPAIFNFANRNVVAHRNFVAGAPQCCGAPQIVLTAIPREVSHAKFAKLEQCDVMPEGSTSVHRWGHS